MVDGGRVREKVCVCVRVCLFVRFNTHPLEPPTVTVIHFATAVSSALAAKRRLHRKKGA